MALPILALVSAAQSLYQMSQSSNQRKTAANLQSSNYIPPGVQEAVENARTGINGVGPGYTRGLQKLGRSTANYIRTAQRIGGPASNIQQAAQDASTREQESIKDLEVANSVYKEGKKRDLNSLLAMKGQYEKQAYDDSNAAKSALIGASKQNEWNALTGLAEGVVSSLPDSAFSDQVFNRPAPAGEASLTKTPGLTGGNFLKDTGTAPEVAGLKRTSGMSSGFNFNKALDPTLNAYMKRLARMSSLNLHF